MYVAYGCATVDIVRTVSTEEEYLVAYNTLSVAGGNPR
jgi:hypothetical protein